LISQGASRGLYNVFKKEMENKYEGKVRVHSITNFYEGTHVDTSISIIGYNKRVKKYIAIF